MTDTKQLTDEELKQVSGGIKIGGDDHFEEVTQLLKDAGDRAWAKLGGSTDGLWYYINQAEKTTSSVTRKQNIQLALNSLEYSKNSLAAEDYNFIKEKLDESNELTK